MDGRAVVAEIRAQRAMIWALIGILSAAVCGRLADLVLQAAR